MKTGSYSRIVKLLSEFSIPLISGVLLALVAANLLGEDIVRHYFEYPLFGAELLFLGHSINFHFLINDIFMVFFFGIAAVEIAQAVLPGGSLNPIHRAINPILGTLGGILGPVGVYFGLCYFLGVDKEVYRGWGIPTATDIALAWLVARFIFGRSHPAVSFLLLLAVADDAIGLGIIAIFYPDPYHPVEPLWLLLTALGMLLACFLSFKHVKNFWYYLVLGGLPSWLGLLLAHLHPALALVFIVPFMPAGHGKHKELFVEEHEKTTLASFEHFFKIPVDMGLFGFGLANAAVAFSGVSTVTWIVLASLFFGKVLGIGLFSYIGHLAGLKLPQKVGGKELLVLATIAGIGLTVALFVAGEAFTKASLQGAAKMGALFSALIALVAFLLAKLLGIKSEN